MLRTSRRWLFSSGRASLRRSSSASSDCAQSDDALEERLGETRAEEKVHRRDVRSTDLRTYGIGAQILRDLGVGKMRLMAAPRKMPSMTGFGLEVTGYVESPRG